MSSYRPMALAEAASIMAPKLGLTMEDNKPEVITFVNRYRNLLYNRYDRLRLFDNVWACFCPSMFHNECSSCNPCDRCYAGFTLPREMAGIVDAWQWNQPLRYRNAWRESYTERAPSGGSIKDIVEVRENFPTERDLRGPATLQVYGEALSDRDKSVVVEARNTDNRDVKIEFVLGGDGATSSDVVVRKIHNVILPSDRKGSIVLSDSTGYELSVYSPGENMIPAYKRYKLPGTCRSNVLVQGTRQLTDVWFDQDVVEIGDRMVLEFMGTYFKYYDSMDQREVVKAEQALANAYANLDGLVARDDGGHLPQPIVRGKSKPSLPGYNRRYPVPRYP